MKCPTCKCDLTKDFQTVYQLGANETAERIEKTFEVLMKNNKILLRQIESLAQGDKSLDQLITANHSLFEEARRLDAFFPDLDSPAVRIPLNKIRRIIRSLKKIKKQHFAIYFEQLISKQLGTFPKIADELGVRRRFTKLES